MDTPEPVACTLTPIRATSQLREWEELQRLASDVRSIPDGARLTLPLATLDDVEDLAERERRCCSFLDITTETDERSLTVTITSPRRDARAVIAALLGVER